MSRRSARGPRLFPTTQIVQGFDGDSVEALAQDAKLGNRHARRRVVKLLTGHAKALWNRTRKGREAK